MCLGHVYIVLEPVGSARLKLDDDRYYEFCVLMYRHDEESRNGRDIKIDILDDYVPTPEVFREVSDIYRSTGGLPEPPGVFIGPNGP